MSSKKGSDFGERLLKGAREAVAVARGEIQPARVRRYPLSIRSAMVEAPPSYDAKRIKKVRERVHVSQALFARALNVSRETVRAWEGGRRVPEGATLRLLEIADRRPEVLFGAVQART